MDLWENTEVVVRNCSFVDNTAGVRRLRPASVSGRRLAPPRLQHGGAVFVSTDSPFKSVLLADCRGSGNDDSDGCAIDDGTHCLKNCTHSRPSAIALSRIPLLHR